MPSYTVLARCRTCSSELQLDVPPAAGRERLELAARLAYLRIFPSYYCCGSGTDVASVVEWPDADPSSDAYFDGAAELSLSSLEAEVAACRAATLAVVASRYPQRKDAPMR